MTERGIQWVLLFFLLFAAPPYCLAGPACTSMNTKTKRATDDTISFAGLGQWMPWTDPFLAPLAPVLVREKEATPAFSGDKSSSRAGRARKVRASPAPLLLSKWTGTIGEPPLT